MNFPLDRPAFFIIKSVHNLIALKLNHKISRGIIVLMENR